MRRTLGGRRVWPWLALLLAAGCGPRLCRVHGKVTLEDGTPVTKGLVVFEAVGGQPVSARGEIQADGSYQLSTHRPGDGVPPGRYRVLINPMDLSAVPDEQKQLVFDIKYLKLETSGLEYEVKPGSNEYAITLSKPRKAPG
jgi:hypothetical protein